jgi:hypothetical protein
MFNSVKSTELLATKQYSIVTTYKCAFITAHSLDKPSKGPQHTTCLTNTITVKHNSAHVPKTDRLYVIAVNNVSVDHQ